MTTAGHPLSAAERADRIAVEHGFMARGPCARAIEREIKDALADAAVAALGGSPPAASQEQRAYARGREHAWASVMELRALEPKTRRKTAQHVL